MSPPKTNNVKLPKYNEGKSMQVLRILQRNETTNRTRKYIFDQDLENPWGGVGVCVWPICSTQLCVWIQLSKVSTREGVEKGEDLDLKSLGFGPSLVLAINESVRTAQSILWNVEPARYLSIEEIFLS